LVTILVPYHLDEPQIRLSAALPPGVPDITVTPPMPGGGAWKRYGALHDCVADAVREALASDTGSAVGVSVVSGDCLVALGTVAGVQRAGFHVGIVWFDAHGDVQTVETSASGYPGGMPMRILAGYRPPELAGPGGLEPIDEGRLALVDARDLDPPEFTYLAGSRIGQVAVADLDASALPPGPLVLHVDLDVVDAAALPGLRYPVTPGPSPAAVLAAVERVIDTGRVVALDVAATWFDGPDTPPEAGARLVAALLTAAARGGRAG
jgi:arginase